MMRIVRGLGGTVLWLLAGVLGLLAVVLCVTVLLLPVGIPLLRVSRRMFGQATRLMLPKAVAHPVKSAKGSVGDAGSKAGSALSGAAEKVTTKPSRLPWRRRKRFSLG
jgi:hypothetical protein